MSGAAAGGDPSMEDILASIRRILDEDQPEPAPVAYTAPAAAPPPSGPIGTPVAEPPPSDELVLDASMLIDTPPAAAVPHPAEPPPRTRTIPMPSDSPPAPGPGPEMPYPGLGLIGSAAAENAASSVTSLMRAVAGDRASTVHRDGPTIEDVVRDEIRPLLKDWLNMHLPPLVERLVRAEIERVISRAAL